VLFLENRAEQHVISGKPRVVTDKFYPDVLIIGLGPAGAAAAARASQCGLEVLALDRRRVSGIPVQCAELVPAMIGQDAELSARAITQPVTRMVTHVETEPSDEKVLFPGYMINRFEFDQLQVKAAVTAGADCRFGVPVSCLRADGAVQTKTGMVIRAKVVVGADGPLSIVGRAINQKNTELVYARQVSVPLNASSDATEIFLSADIPGGYGWLFPQRKRANVGVGVDAGWRHRLRPLLHAFLGELSSKGWIENSANAETGGAIPVGGMLMPYATHGDRLILLAGDAAGLTNPVTGAGIQAALVSGRLAGECAEAWVEGNREAPSEYTQELTETFGASIDRAQYKRQRLVESRVARNGPTKQELRDSWIAYPSYWCDPTAAEMKMKGVSR